MNKNKKKAYLIVGILLALLFIAGAYNFNKTGNLLPFSATYEGKEVIYTVPLMASIRCEKIDTSYPSYSIPIDGWWISQSDIGGVTDGVKDIKVIVQNSWVNAYLRSLLGGGARFYYKICDQNKQNCGVENTQSIIYGGTFNLDRVPSSIDIRKNSLYLVIQSRNTILSSWKNIKADATVNYNFDQYGLVIYSSVGVGIKTVCFSSCNLNCPDIGIREKIVSTPKDSLNFNEAVNYISTWVDVSQKAEQLGGGTVWNPSDKTFCFGGFLYKSGEISTETEKTYIYPKDYVGKKDCCQGAVISTQYEDKICQSDYTWKTINKDTRIKCSGDFNCPNSGTSVCRNKLSSGWKCSGYDSIIGRFCEQSQGTSVQCCVQSDCSIDQVCSNNKCQGGAVIPPTPINECIYNSDCISGASCVGGKCIGGSNGTISNNVCASCDKFVMSQIFGSFWKSKQCNARVGSVPLGVIGGLVNFVLPWKIIPNLYPQTNTTCAGSWIKIGMVIISFLFTLLFGISTSSSIRKKSVKIIAVITTIILSFVFAYLTWTLFWLGVIISVIGLVAIVLIKLFLPIKFVR